MSDIAIAVNGLSKQYILGARLEKYSTLRDRISDAFRRPAALVRGRSKRKSKDAAEGPETLWALKDVSFEVKRGEVVGVIGRNGAGKSTLLKILSRITSPTSGYAELHGRVGALLEVGTGFHMELSGRENIYLNGAILGMRKAEIDAKFDEVVAFAEVDRFIDTQVKHYSSGMYLRLAFAVAAHLQPETLLVDEVLAVGDAAFQRKCIGKMEEVAAHGRTVMFVSHNLGAVKELCHTALVLHNGKTQFRGPVVEGLAKYSQSVNADDGAEHRSGWTFLSLNGTSRDGFLAIKNVDDVVLRMRIDVPKACKQARVFWIVQNFVGDQVVHCREEIGVSGEGEIPPGAYEITFRCPALWLVAGVYTMFLKFLAQTDDREDVRLTSDRMLVDVQGPVDATNRSTLAPPAKWEIAPIASSVNPPPDNALTATAF